MDLDRQSQKRVRTNLDDESQSDPKRMNSRFADASFMVLNASSSSQDSSGEALTPQQAYHQSLTTDSHYQNLKTRDNVISLKGHVEEENFTEEFAFKLENENNSTDIESAYQLLHHQAPSMAGIEGTEPNFSNHIYVREAREVGNDKNKLDLLKLLSEQIKLLEGRQRENGRITQRLEERISRHKIKCGEYLQKVSEAQRALEERRAFLSRDSGYLEEQKRNEQELLEQIRSLTERMHSILDS